MEPLKSHQNQLQKHALDNGTIVKIGENVSKDQFMEACQLILKKVSQENAIAILDTLGISAEHQKALEIILQNSINASKQGGASRSCSGSMRPTTDGSNSSDSNSSVESINHQVNIDKIRRTDSLTGSISPTTDSDL